MFAINLEIYMKVTYNYYSKSNLMWNWNVIFLIFLFNFQHLIFYLHTSFSYHLIMSIFCFDYNCINSYFFTICWVSLSQTNLNSLFNFWYFKMFNVSFKHFSHGVQKYTKTKKTPSPQMSECLNSVQNQNNLPGGMTRWKNESTIERAIKSIHKESVTCYRLNFRRLIRVRDRRS